MAPNRPRFSSHGAVAGLALLATLVGTPRAWSQHTPDPYNYVGEYNRGYEPYMFPTLPNEQGFVPGQAAMMGRAGIRQSNQFQSYLQGLDGSEGDGLPRAPGARVGLSNSYYQAYRQYDRDYGRTYAPNQEADRSYYEDLRTRHAKILKYQEASREKYADYVRERDPTRRARLYREYLDLDQRSALESGALRGGPTQSNRTGSAASMLNARSATETRSRTPAPSPATLPAPAPSGSTRGGSRSSSSRRGAAPGLAPRRNPAPPLLPGGSDFPESSPRSSQSMPSETLRRSELMERAKPEATPGTTRPAAPRPLDKPRASRTNERPDRRLEISVSVGRRKWFARNYPGHTPHHKHHSRVNLRHEGLVARYKPTVKSL